MKKVLLIIVLGLAAYTGYWVLEGFFSAMLNDKRTSRSQLSLAEIAKRANATLPKQIDENTQLDKEIAGPGNRMTYQCTSLNLAAADVDTNQLTAKPRPMLVQAYKTLPELERYRTRQVELKYEYRDKAHISLLPYWSPRRTSNRQNFLQGSLDGLTPK